MHGTFHGRCCYDLDKHQVLSESVDIYHACVISTIRFGTETITSMEYRSIILTEYRIINTIGLMCLVCKISYNKEN